MIAIKDFPNFGLASGNNKLLFSKDIVYSTSGHKKDWNNLVDDSLALLITNKIDSLIPDYIQCPSCVTVTSSWRDFIPAGGAKNSTHLQGRAFDISFNSEDHKRIVDFIMTRPEKFSEFGGIGVYDTHIHFDSRTTPSSGKYGQYFAFWDYRTDKKKSENNTEGIDKDVSYLWALLALVVIGVIITR